MSNLFVVILFFLCSFALGRMTKKCPKIHKCCKNKHKNEAVYLNIVAGPITNKDEIKDNQSQTNDNV